MWRLRVRPIMAYSVSLAWLWVGQHSKICFQESVILSQYRKLLVIIWQLLPLLCKWLWLLQRLSTRMDLWVQFEIGEMTAQRTYSTLFDLCYPALCYLLHMEIEYCGRGRGHILVTSFAIRSTFSLQMIPQRVVIHWKIISFYWPLRFFSRDFNSTMRKK